MGHRRLVLIGVLAAYLPAYTDREGFWTFDGDAIRWLGVVLFAAGGALRIWPVFVLGRRFSGLVAIQPGHTLVTNGVYGIIRHPLFGVARQFARVGSRFPVGRRRVADSASYPAAPCPHTCGRETAEHAVRRRVRYLLQAHIAADPGGVLNQTTTVHQAGDWSGSGSARTPRSAKSPVATAATTANRQALKKICRGAIPNDSRYPPSTGAAIPPSLPMPSAQPRPLVRIRAG